MGKDTVRVSSAEAIQIVVGGLPEKRRIVGLTGRVEAFLRFTS